VYVSGVWDLLSVSHVKVLEAIEEMFRGAYLLVGVYTPEVVNYTRLRV
jgi:hypothetical protein